MKAEMVYSITDERNILAVRQSNKTILVNKRKKIRDTDNSHLEDKNGHRYKRDIELEQLEPEYKVYCMY